MASNELTIKLAMTDLSVEFIKHVEDVVREHHDEKMKALIKGIMKIRDEITASDGDTPRWVSMDLNALVNQFMDEKSNLK